SATRHYEVRKHDDASGNDSTLAVLHTDGVWVDIASGRPIRILIDLLTDFANNISGWESPVKESVHPV
ncbi:MAG: hypothetical protein ACK2U9_03710, partial [Anaerolineae bacterium]